LSADGGEILLRFRSPKVNLVAGSVPSQTLSITVDGKPQPPVTVRGTSFILSTVAPAVGRCCVWRYQKRALALSPSRSAKSPQPKFVTHDPSSHPLAGVEYFSRQIFLIASYPAIFVLRGVWPTR
jgi:hypothetical protein